MNDKLEKTLSSIDNLRDSGDNQWTGLCPAHDDNKNSLSIKYDEEKDNVLIHCHAGCTYEQVCAAINKKNQAKSNPQGSRNSKKKIIATYEYVDENNNLLYEVVRTDPKGFFQRRPDGKGGWINGLPKETRKVLYKLPYIQYAIEEGEPIYLVEGEKDVDRLNALGLISTTSAMGASSWRSEYANSLIGADVVLIPDNDPPGRDFAHRIFHDLKGKAASIKLITLPGLSEKQDVSDYLDSGNSLNDLLDLVSRTPYLDLSEIDITPCEKEKNLDHPLTDLGNAERLVELHGGDIRYCFEANSWLIWDGTRWVWDKNGEITRRAKQTVRSIYEEAALIDDTGKRKQLVEWALSSESKNSIKSMVELAKSEPEIPILRNQLDQDPWLLNCKNGTINLKNGELFDHHRDDYITCLAPVVYDPNADNEVFDKFLERILPLKELRDFIQRAAGYSITGDTREEKLFFAFGPPATGKSTLFAGMKAALGDYAVTTDFETFLERKGNSGGPRNDIARLAGKRFVLGSEVDEGKKLAEGLVKQITGNDTITARFLHQEFFEFKPTMKLWLASNFKPRVNASDAAMWRRILQTPFEVEIPKAERDPHVKLTIGNPEIAGSAIMNWLVQGCLQWQAQGLNVPEIIESETAAYRAENNPLKDFFTDCCLRGMHMYTSNSALWSAYESWANENGEKYTISRKRFSQLLEAEGFVQRRTSTQRLWYGIGLIAEQKVTYLTQDDAKFNVF